jgi:hypothetical protein
MGDENICWECNKKLIHKKVDYSLYGVSLGTFTALVCEGCHETLFSEETSRLITKKAKAKGLWGLGYKTKIGQAGSTLDIRLNKKIIDFLGIKKGVEVSVHPENKHKLVVTLS